MATLAGQAIFFMPFFCPNPNPIYISRFGNITTFVQQSLMSFHPDAPAPNTHAPDSPRSSQSPPPTGPQGDLELELHGLANALYNLGTTVINDSTKERDKPGGGKQVGLRAYVSPTCYDARLLVNSLYLSNEVGHHLTTIDDMAQNIRTMIPFQVLQDIDNSRNPMQLTKDRLERAATENQFMNGKLAAIDSYRRLLNEALAKNFPDTAEYLYPKSSTKEPIDT
ncbi:hypothetical protein JVU11DRAFT_1380 [Chiua virens]|nr:hypothetical protein JVU11DRAFT_1380 [Chiua virens]